MIPSKNRSASGTGNDSDRPQVVNAVESTVVDPIVQILEHGVREFRLKFDRSDIRRAAFEAVRTWLGSVQERWWKWLVEAGESVDLRVSVIECTLEKALGCVEEGMHLAVFLEGQSQPWLAVDEFSGRKARVFSRVRASRFDGSVARNCGEYWAILLPRENQFLSR